MIADSYWMDTTAAISFPALTEPVEADVVAICAGIAVIATAWELSRTLNWGRRT